MDTQNGLINRLASLKQVKPNQEWVVLTKNQILIHTFVAPKVQKADYVVFWKGFFQSTFTKKLAYSMAVLLFVVSVGTFFVFKNSFVNDQNNVAKNDSSLASLQSSVASFTEKSKNLSQVAKYNPENVPTAVQEVSDAAKNLTAQIQKNPKLAKDVALEINNNKTYLDIQGSDEDDLKETSSNLYKTVVKQMIKDLEAQTLTDSQQESLDAVKSLYDDGNYTSALENILLLNNSISSNN